MPSQPPFQEAPTPPESGPSRELSHWERLLLSFDTHNRQSIQTRNPQGQSSGGAGIHSAARFDQLPATAGTMFSSQHGTRYPPISHGHFSASGFGAQAEPSDTVPFVSPINLSRPFHGQQSHPLSTRTTWFHRSDPSTSSAAAEADYGEEDEEEKRRRNTVASARFRIKKKQKILDLERTVSDLAGRAEELEREAAELRRENSWLKEIVILKGGQLTGIALPGENRDPLGQSSEVRCNSPGDGMDSEQSSED
ncbi:hypothetical protein MVEN_02174000 [Mycena venus]|uniref:BZIP domain-containing protein n=1 Tax=Mycena venus TaxID=2733690 RepID=A0A8H6X961_9AGAR|nr:hypothetical protein MVEN_02174000 [Mycena venus]